MTLTRPLAALCLLLCSTGAAWADAAPLDLAGETACRLDRVREIIAGAEQSSSDADAVDQLIVENTADWLPDYTAFATSPEAADLLAASTAMGDKPTAAECRQLLPFAAVSASAARISRAGGDIAPGVLLTSCETGSGLCTPPATTRIIDQCGTALFILPLRSTC